MLLEKIHLFFPAKPATDSGSKWPPIGAKRRWGIIVSLRGLWIPAGSFDTTKTEDENPVRTVKINKGFWLGQFEVTQAQWRAVMNDDPSSFKGDNLPVEQVSWDEVDSFIRKLNSMGQGGFRLPTEAEWEYACRAGTKSEFCYGVSLDSSQANFDGNYP